MALSDPFHLIDTTRLYPPFVAKLHQLVISCAARGYVFFASSALRTVAEQEQLYKQGRSTPGKVVTNAKGGQSAHQFGIAVDFTHDADNQAFNGLQPDWSKGPYQVLAEEAVRLGLEPGFNWEFADAPHIQLPLDSKGIALFKDGTGRPDLLTLLQTGGHECVFSFLDGFEW